MTRPGPSPRALARAAVLCARAGAGPSAITSHWDSTGLSRTPLRLAVGKTQTAARVAAHPDGRFGVRLSDGAEEIEVAIVAEDGDRIRFLAGGVESAARVIVQGDTLHVAVEGAFFTIRETSLDTARAGDKAGDAQMRAPMNGRIVAVLAKAGDKVAKGQRVVILEAMKMQHEIVSPRDGALASVNVNEGDQVATRQVLAALEEAAP